jgi:hypothetical protein
MSPSLPVPSKGALRTLRQIALGTSCTVAFGAGLITEDRRRRIHSTREVSDNARRLKTSRNYHSAGPTVPATFEEQVQSYCQYGPWAESGKQRFLDRDSSDRSIDVTARVETSTTESGSNLVLPISEPSYLYIRRWPIRLSNNSKVEQIKKSTTSTTGEERSAKLVAKPPDWQRLLARNMLDILEGDPDAEAIEAAARCFVESFPEGKSRRSHEEKPLDRHLLTACVLLVQTCKRLDMLDPFIPILQKIVGFAPLDVNLFYELQAAAVIARLLEQSGYEPHHKTVTDLEKLNAAISIFCAEFPERPGFLPKTMLEVGIQLSAAALQAKLYVMTEGIYFRLWWLAGEPTQGPFPGLDNLILAAFRRSKYSRAIRYFSRFYVKTTPENQDMFYGVVTAAFDSALELHMLDRAEDILVSATKMTQDGSLTTSTTWYLRLLGEHWRTTGNLSSTQALFRRLEPLFSGSSHPWAMYSAIIQFCIEAGCTSDAEQYVERLKTTRGTPDLDLRTYGHFALAKAQKNDWTGVEEDFSYMRSFADEAPSDYGAVFVPVLKLFASSHSTSQLEEFVHFYIEKLGIVPNQYIFNVMVAEYCKAGEFDSIIRWIAYLQPLGLHIDAATFNSILTTCWKNNSMPFRDMIQLCKKSKLINSALIDSLTISILRSAATAAANGDPETLGRLMKQVEIFQPGGRSLDRKNIRVAVRDSLAKENPTRALKMFWSAIKMQSAVSPELVAAAVTAAMRSTPDASLEAAVKVIDGARSRGINIYPALTRLFIHQLETMQVDKDDVQSMLKATLIALKKRDLEMSLGVASKLMMVLVNRGLSKQAIEFWICLSRFNRISPRSLDLVILTVLMKAFIAHSDLRGIKGVMTVMTENGIMPDRQFKGEVKNAKKVAEKWLAEDPNSEFGAQRLALLSNCLRMVTAQRSQFIVKRKKAEEMTLHILESAAMPNASDALFADALPSFQADSLNQEENEEEEDEFMGLSSSFVTR